MSYINYQESYNLIAYNYSENFIIHYNKPRFKIIFKTYKFRRTKGQKYLMISHANKYIILYRITRILHHTCITRNKLI